MNGFATGGPVNEPAAFVTFDDGYRDNFVEAVPILKEFDVPATFFIPTEFLESPNLPWWDHVAYVIKQTAKRQLRLKGSPSDDDSPLEVELDGNSRDAAISAIIRAILEGRVADLPWFLEHLAAQAEVQVNSQILGRDLFMGWEEVRQLIEHGGRLTIGSHAHSHPNLSKLDLDLQQRELGLSKQILEERLGREIAAIAYPFGWPGTYNDATKKAAREAGYRLAFASRTGVNHLGALDPFEINRIGVGAGDSPAMLRRARPFSQLLAGRSCEAYEVACGRWMKQNPDRRALGSRC